MFPVITRPGYFFLTNKQVAHKFTEHLSEQWHFTHGKYADIRRAAQYSVMTWGTIQYIDAVIPYRKSHFGDKAIVRPSYLNSGIFYTCNMTYSYWIRAYVMIFVLRRIHWSLVHPPPRARNAELCLCILWIKNIEQQVDSPVIGYTMALLLSHYTMHCSFKGQGSILKAFCGYHYLFLDFASDVMYPIIVYSLSK